MKREYRSRAAAWSMKLRGVTRIMPSVAAAPRDDTAYSSQHADFSSLACDFAHHRRLPAGTCASHDIDSDADERVTVLACGTARRSVKLGVEERAAPAGHSARDGTARAPRRISGAESIDPSS